jgi:hypothetical protein
MLNEERIQIKNLCEEIQSQIDSLAKKTDEQIKLLGSQQFRLKLVSSAIEKDMDRRRSIGELEQLEFVLDN